MVSPGFLTTTEPDGYYTKTIIREVVLELDEHGVESQHSSFEKAMEEITSKSDKLKNRKLTILPVMDINYEGKIA